MPERKRCPLNLIQRITDILLNPDNTWPLIAQEPANAASIYRNYLIFLAAIPAVAGLIGHQLDDARVFEARICPPFIASLVNMLALYALGLATVFVLTFIVNSLAPSFGGQKNQINAMKLAAYGATAGFVGGMFALVPAFSMLGSIGVFYSVYLIYIGLPVLMKCPPDKALSYIVAVGVWVTGAGVIFWGVSAIFMSGLPMQLECPRSKAFGHNATAIVWSVAAGVLFGALSTAIFMSRLGRRIGGTEGDSLSVKTPGENSKMAAVTGDLRTQDLGVLVPVRLGALQRKSIEAQSGQSIGMRDSSFKASYVAGNQRIDLSITYLGIRRGSLVRADWGKAMGAQKGPETMVKIFQRGLVMVREEFRTDGRGGKISMLLTKGVMVEAQGQGMDGTTLKAALLNVNFSPVEAMQRPELQP